MPGSGCTRSHGLRAFESIIGGAPVAASNDASTLLVSLIAIAIGMVAGVALNQELAQRLVMAMPRSYAVSIFFMTAFIVMSTALGGGLVQEFSLDRVVATILGVIIAFVMVGIQVRLVKPEDLSDA